MKGCKVWDFKLSERACENRYQTRKSELATVSWLFLKTIGEICVQKGKSFSPQNKPSWELSVTKRRRRERRKKIFRGINFLSLDFSFFRFNRHLQEFDHLAIRIMVIIWSCIINWKSVTASEQLFLEKSHKNHRKVIWTHQRQFSFL